MTKMQDYIIRNYTSNLVTIYYPYTNAQTPGVLVSPTYTISNYLSSDQFRIEYKSAGKSTALTWNMDKATGLSSGLNIIESTDIVVNEYSSNDIWVDMTTMVYYRYSPDLGFTIDTGADSPNSSGWIPGLDSAIWGIEGSTPRLHPIITIIVLLMVVIIICTIVYILVFNKNKNNFSG